MTKRPTLRSTITAPDEASQAAAAARELGGARIIRLAVKAR